jgi:hypothetical protein
MEHIKLFKCEIQRTHSFAFRQIGLYGKEEIKPQIHFLNTKTLRHKVTNRK